MGAKGTHKNLDVIGVMDLVVDMSQLMIRNGAEIFRVEETIQHISKHYEVEDVNAFVMSNGIFISAKIDETRGYSKVKHIPLSSSHLGIVTALNDLSRNICFGKISLEEAKAELEEIKKIPATPRWFRTVAAGFGSAGFCYLLGATLVDTSITCIIAMIIFAFIIFCEKHQLSRVIQNTMGGAIACAICVCLYALVGDTMVFSLDKVIIGSILPMVPGLPFVNAVRDVANNDILSGLIKLTNALLVFVYVAIGVGVVLSLSTNIVGMGVL